MESFNGLGTHLGNLSRLSTVETRSSSPENFSGAKGEGEISTDGPAASSARELGQGWKVSPFINIGPRETATIAEIDVPGAIQHTWLTVHPSWRHEAPLGDFFANGWGQRRNVSSTPVTVNPAGGSTATGKCHSASMRESRSRTSPRRVSPVSTIRSPTR